MDDAVAREAVGEDFIICYRMSMVDYVEDGQSWDEIIVGQALPSYAKPREQAWRHWAAALAYANKGDIDQAEKLSKESHESVVSCEGS